MREQTKECFQCKISIEVLNWCRYEITQDWVFLYDPILLDIKEAYSDTHQYDGT